MIHTRILRENWQKIRNLAGKAALCPAVKADAYGHGLVPVAQILAEEGADAFGLACVEEGEALRKAGLPQALLLLGAAQREEFGSIVALDLQPFVFDAEAVQALAQEARFQNKTLKVHLKIDTGMGRVGCRPEDAAALARLIAHQMNLELEGVCTHFAASDGPGPMTVAQQMTAFQTALDQIAQEGFQPRFIHAANSGALLDYPETHFNMIRPGIVLYGYPAPGQTGAGNFRPVMELVSRVAFVKEVPAGTALSYGSRYVTREKTRVATIPIGYGDGYRRAFTNQAPVLIGGRVYQVSGTVCMDQFMVDLGPDSPVKAGDEVVLFGPGPGAPTAQSLADLAQTIPYELLCGITARVPRLYVD